MRRPHEGIWHPAPHRSERIRACVSGEQAGNYQAEYYEMQFHCRAIQYPPRSHQTRIAFENHGALSQERPALYASVPRPAVPLES